ncbi:MAG TPA: AAA family ATPase [Thermoanaerobaculia bacterium]|nr:AAA family ATPase [Thermoanaerobaculia bacterium]
MSLSIPIGIDDFRLLRERGLAYVDKSSLIRELLDEPGVGVVLLPRPRRFGKTVNLSMLRYFFEKREEDLSHLFQDLAIWQAGDAYRAHFQRYPVIFFNFKGVRGEQFEVGWGAIREKIVDLYKEHVYLLEGGRLDEVDVRRFRQILDGTAEQALYDRALFDLSSYLHRHHGEKVVILIDEYDSPIHVAHAHRYAPRMLDFMRAFLGAGLKTNPHLQQAVLTGILRIAKESLFSDVNHIGVYTLLAVPFNTCFGFTEAEVTSLLERTGTLDRLEIVRAWYNGYLFGGEVIYNPWSVLSYLQRRQAEPEAYWLSTSSNDLVRELLERYALELQPVFESLLEGGHVERLLEENVVLGDLHRSEDALFSLLVFAGYLKAERRSRGPAERAMHRLSIPNREVRQVYATTFRAWMKARLEGHGGGLERLTAALLGGDAARLEEQLQAFVTNLLSYQDTGASDPERVYHGFVLGMLAVMEPEYLVRSNRESGDGRPDVMIRAREPGKPAAVLELKVARKGEKTPAAALREGLGQIRERRYEAELLSAGASVVHAFAVAFDGKRVWVKAGGAAAAAKKKAGGRKKKARR